MNTSIQSQPLWERIQTEYIKKSPELSQALSDLSTQLKAFLKQEGVSSVIKSRVKDRDSYYHKLKNAYKQEPLNDYPLSDLLGMRIVVPFLENVEQVVRLFEKNFSIVEREDKSSSLSFREFSYDSTHLLIPYPGNPDSLIHGNQNVIEVQIRTTLQDAWAEVEHQLIYKTQINYPNEKVKRKMASLNANLTLSDIIFQEIRDFQKSLEQDSETRLQMMNNKIEPDEFDDQLRNSHPENNPEAEQIPESFEDLFQLALKSHSNKSYKQSIKLYSQAIPLTQECKILSIIHNHKGMAHFMLSQYEEAIEDFNLAIANDDKNFRAYSNRGIIYRLLRQLEHAKSDFIESLEINHKQEDIWIYLSQCYFKDDELSEALDAINTALSLNPDSAKAQKLRLKISERLIP